jgi:hypothetical protein
MFPLHTTLPVLLVSYIIEEWLPCSQNGYRVHRMVTVFTEWLPCSQNGYRVHKTLPLDPNLSHANPVHALISFFFEDHFSIILPSTPSSTKSFFPLGFPAKTLYIPSPKCPTCPSHSIFYFITLCYLMRGANLQPRHAFPLVVS